MLPKYKLISLGWYNFENLILILLKEIIGPGVKSFGGTKDLGREATFTGEANFPSEKNKWDGDWIFQVKFNEFEKINTIKEQKKLIKLIVDEIEKLNRNDLYFDNYILFVNFSITNTLKDNIYKYLQDNFSSNNFHIVDGKEISEFLDIYPKIRTNFPQLLSLADISYLINKGTYEKSKAFLENWKEKLISFVAVKPYFKGLSNIEKNHFIVLDGPPEAGKSYIGAAISLVYATNNYEIYFIDNPNSFFDLYDDESKQLFFFDDALGPIAYDSSLGQKWSKDFPALLRRIDNNHKLIWTVRSYILKDALELTKIQEDIENFPKFYEILIEIEDYSKIEKALMLYNHAKNSNLSSKLKKFIKDNCEKILQNEYLTPERIRQIIRYLEDLEKIQNFDSKKILQEINIFVKNPGKKFKKAFDSLKNDEKELLLILVENSFSISKTELKKKYEQRI